MIDVLWLKAVIKALILPPTSLLLVATIGIGIGSRLPRVARLLVATGVLGLVVLSIPAVAKLLMQSVDTSSTLEIAQARTAKAIVILGGGVRLDAPEYGGDTLGTLTLERVRYGAHVARLTGLPILVSGGSVLEGQPEAKLMQASLEDEFGIAVRWVEARSRTTHENAVESAAVLRKDSVDRVVLVAHAFDMRRAVAEFEAQGVSVIGAPTGKPSRSPARVLDFLPSMSGLQGSYYATYEMLANLVRVVSGNR